MISLVLALAVAAPQIPSPPVVASPRLAVPSLVEFEPGQVRCGDTVVSATLAPRALPTSIYVNADEAGPVTYTLRFRIDASGRPLSISEPVRLSARNIYVSTEDLAPTLAAWRFPAGGERSGCTVDFVMRAQPVTTAPIEQLYRFMALPRIGAAAYAMAAKRVGDEAPHCFRPRAPAERLRAFPDFDAIPQPLGTMAYTMVGFDIDKSGKTARAHTLSSDGNAVLDRAGIDAVRRSRFAPGVRMGCHYPYYRRQNAPMPAPPGPDKASFVKPDATCDSKSAWVKQPLLSFPDPYRRRAIEGWAVVAYDVAPWGATGNVRVLASEPAAAFGQEAQRIVSSATRAPSTSGASGCVERVVFRLPDDEHMANETAPAPIVVN